LNIVGTKPFKAARVLGADALVDATIHKSDVIGAALRGSAGEEF
jgi:hypothetical protein